MVEGWGEDECGGRYEKGGGGCRGVVVVEAVCVVCERLKGGLID